MIRPPKVARRSRLLIALPLLVSAGSLPASQTCAQSATESIALDEIVVSATARPTPAREIANSVTVITAGDIEREQRRTLPQALAAVPGLNVVQTGGPGGLTSVFIRGTNSNHVKVLIDGIEANDPATPNRSFDFGSMLTDDIERIEVLRGPQSGLYGANALGGVISITTKRGEGSPKLTARAEAGSYGTFNQAVGLSGGDDRFNYALSIAHFKSDSTPVTPPGLVPPGRRSNPNSYDNWTYSARFGVALSDTLSLNWVGRYTDGYLLFTGDSGFPSTPSGFRSSQDYKQAFTRGEVVWDPLGGRFVNRFGLSYSNQDRTGRTPNAIGILGLPTENLGERTKVDWRGDLELMKGQTLVMGLQYERERLETRALTASNGNTGAFAELQSNFGDRLFMVSNIRYDDDETFGGHTTYRFAPAYIVPGTETKLKASYGTGFKAPTLSERFSDFRPASNFFGNPNLKPEESRGWDLGFEQPLLADKVRFGATYFHNDIENLIVTNVARDSYANIGKATTKGVEAFAALEISPQFKVRADYTFTIAKDDIARQELLRRPRHKASVTASWTPVDKLTLSATLIYVGERVDGNRDFSISRMRAPGAAIVNLAAEYQATDRLSVFGRIDNLLDKRYENPVGFLVPGLSAYGGLKVTL
ncbi:TonB-dependent siderophore receptor [Bosea sp. BIWAKO-01]|uniref:TonB-dependent receptor plug domain-containing protein n=1 Tax=Bosea sp. BIWAKO-01 TaxID=506668 RepID=UPI00086D14E4|nr:TonB-dependent receptor [Bosea sp. BIWAKO-01]GAU84522.1 outer membrane vitamin B12 receptor BtuB [Bosea sp. BIWAKO-01]